MAIGRALWANLMRGGVVQGGSTITQQLAKNLFYSPQRTMERKLREVVAAFVMEWKYRKEEILESYLNEIYLGQAGSVSIYGIGEAAHRYFAKPLEALSIEEIALVAGLIKGPNTYSPTKNLEHATLRRNVVLRRLRDARVNTPILILSGLAGIEDLDVGGRADQDGASRFETRDKRGVADGRRALTVDLGAGERRQAGQDAAAQVRFGGSGGRAA